MAANFEYPEAYGIDNDTTAELLGWIEDTFGEHPTTVDDVLNHLHEEVEEIRADPKDIMEYVDVYFLLAELMDRAGFTNEDLNVAAIMKLAQLKNRNYQYDKETARYVRQTT